MQYLAVMDEETKRPIGVVAINCDDLEKEILPANRELMHLLSDHYSADKDSTICISGKFRESVNNPLTFTYYNEGVKNVVDVPINRTWLYSPSKKVDIKKCYHHVASQYFRFLPTRADEDIEKFLESLQGLGCWSYPSDCEIGTDYEDWDADYLVDRIGDEACALKTFMEKEEV